MYIRMFSSAIDPDDQDELLQRFREDVKPVYERLGCLAVELWVNSETNAGGLIDGTAISRWESLEQMESAVNDPEAQDAIGRISTFLRHAPSIRVLEVLG